jgi:N utilization substance protein A
MLTKYDIELIEIASLNSSSNNNDNKPAVEEKTTDVASLEALFK